MSSVTSLHYIIPAKPSSSVDESGNHSCKTIGGSFIGKSCHFPFTVHGGLGSGPESLKMYDKCTWDYAYSKHRNGRAWCGTKENIDWTNERNWGDCEEECSAGRDINKTEVSQNSHLTC